jgi:hypothetical protein
MRWKLGIFDFSPARGALAAILRRLRQWRDRRERARGSGDFVVWALTWLGQLFTAYVRFWTNPLIVRAWFVTLAILLSAEAYYDQIVAVPYQQTPEVREKALDGTTLVTVELGVKEGFYTHYRFGKGFENPGDAIGSTPSCRPFWRFRHEALQIIWIMLKAPATAFIDTVVEVPRLDVFQWFIASRLFGNVPGVGEWLDTNGAETARCAAIVVPVPAGTRFVRLEHLTMREAPAGTTQCGSGDNEIPVGLDEEQPCGWMTVSKPKERDVQGRPAVTIEIKNWLHDDRAVERIFRATMAFRPAYTS